MPDVAAVPTLSALTALVNEAITALDDVEKFDGFLPAPVPTVIASLDSVLKLAAEILAKI